MEKIKQVDKSSIGTDPNSGSLAIDRNAPAGSKNSLGAQSVKEGRPSTDDAVVEGMDEVGPEVTDAG
jgi:hypothetical protein